MSGEVRLSGGLTTPRIVFLVVAAAAPLVAMAGTVPLSMGHGNGAGVPGAYLVATVTLVCFSVGYAAMSRSVSGRGGFYAYLARGLGRPFAAAGAVLALVGYNGLVAALAGGLGYFLAHEAGAPGPWWAYSGVAVLIMGLLGRRSIDLSAKVLAALMICEVAVLAVFDIGVLVDRGADALVLESFTPSEVFSGAPGVAFMFAFGSFAGYEAAALYAEESREPAKSVPRATYAAVLVIGVFYTLTSWLMVGALGADDAKAAADAQEGDLFFNITADVLGDVAESVFGLLVITSVFASLLSAHNATNRYLFALAHDGLVPASVGEAHPRLGSPHRASLAQTVFVAVVIAAFAVARLDPYTTLVTVMSGLSTLGIVLLQALTAIACVVHFRRAGGGSWLRTLVLPLVGCAGLLVGAALLLLHFDTLADTDAPAVLALPYVVLLLALAAAVHALRLRRSDPGRYARIGATEGRTDALEPR